MNDSVSRFRFTSSPIMRPFVSYAAIVSRRKPRKKKRKKVPCEKPDRLHLAHCTWGSHVIAGLSPSPQPFLGVPTGEHKLAAYLLMTTSPRIKYERQTLSVKEFELAEAHTKQLKHLISPMIGGEPLSVQ